MLSVVELMIVFIGTSLGPFNVPHCHEKLENTHEDFVICVMVVPTVRHPQAYRSVSGHLML